MPDEKISANPAIDAALGLDGDPDRVRTYYEDWAETYDLDVGSAEYSGPSIAAKLLRQHLSGRNARLLDAGCGTGLVGIELGALGFGRVDGFDLAEAMAAQARASGCYRKVLGGIDMMRAGDYYAEASYDAVLSIGVFTLGHVAPEALRVLLRLTRAGGLMIISTRSQYYQRTGYRQLVDELVAQDRLAILRQLMNAPYNRDGDAHYWVFRKSG
jgi:predicted TPR repeat methyltransferase